MEKKRAPPQRHKAFSRLIQAQETKLGKSHVTAFAEKQQETWQVTTTENDRVIFDVNLIIEYETWKW